MPIKPTHEYSRIPDNEDVTPLDSNIVKRAKKKEKSVKYVTMVGTLLVAFVIISFLGYHYVVQTGSTAVVYQTTSETFGTIASAPFDQFVSPDAILTFSSISITDDCDVKCQFKKLSSSKMYVDNSVLYQKIVGFGGAFTESTAYNFYKLPESVQSKVLQLYFGENGIDLNMGRIHINSCDYSLESYNFDSTPNDYDLLFFDKDVTHDNIQIIPFILKAMQMSKQPIKLVASPWSPPAWMKVPVGGNQSMTGSAQPNGLINTPQMKETWAHYLSKFVTAYERKGVPIWAITPQNEPEFAAPWEACAYDAPFQAEFINDYLGPIIKADHPQIKVLGFDHNKDHLLNWTKVLLANVSNPYVDGMAFHWYGGADRTQDGTFGYNNVNASYHHAKHKLLISTEGCSCPGVSYNDWIRAERLGHDILFDLQNFAQGWIDWNLLLDEHGGPNHLNNFCDASLITNSNFTDIHIQPKYFYFGHFSKFLTPNSIRIKSHIMGNFNYEVMDPIMQPTVEVGMFPCEKSVRQMWGLNAETGTLFLTTRSDITWINTMMQLCLAYGDSARPYLHLADCATSQPEKLLQVEYNLLYGTLIDVRTRLCISLADDVRESGALVALKECKIVESNEQHKEELHDDQFFTMVPGTGEIYALEATNPICLTAGWPFLNAISFHTEKEHHVTIIMNEASVSTTVTLMDIEKESSLQVPIPARSIQTIVY